MSTDLKIPEIVSGRGRERLQMSQAAEARQFALMVVRDPEYRQNLLLRARRGSLAPAVEVEIWNRAYGKQVAQLEVGGVGAFTDMDNLTNTELAARAAELAKLLAAIPDEEKSEEAIAAETAQLQAATDKAVAKNDANTSRALIRMHRAGEVSDEALDAMEEREKSA